MNVNVKLSITDEERNSLANYIDGIWSKRLATRKDVNQFVVGCIEAAFVDVAIDEEPIENMDEVLTEISRLEDIGHTKSYIRGWMQVWCRARGIPHRY